jgi:4a-hydroxytetrahydrobiopterin dehydratase
MECDLANRKCIPCRGGVPPLEGDALASLHEQLDNDWHVVDGHHLEKEFDFKTYLDGAEFTTRVAALAEAQDHHPDILLTWCKVKVTIWTHKIDGLTENDFILAAKIQEFYAP